MGPMTVVAGVDGCRIGWVMLARAPDPGAEAARRRLGPAQGAAGQGRIEGPEPPAGAPALRRGGGRPARRRGADLDRRAHPEPPSGAPAGAPRPRPPRPAHGNLVLRL